MGTEGFKIRPERIDPDAVYKEGEDFRGYPGQLEILSITEEDFKRQFSEEHEIEIEGQESIFYTAVIPENPTSEDWVVYVGGFGQGKDSYLDEIKNVAQSGRKIIFTNPIRGIENEEVVEALHDVPDTIIAKSAAVQRILEEVGAGKVDFVGHSQGAAVVTAFAAAHPEITKKLILECPAGSMGGDDSREKIMVRFVIDKVAGIIDNPKKMLGGAGGRGGKAFFRETIGKPKHIGYRLKEEIPGVAAFDIAPLLEEIQQKEGETEVILVSANNDITYPREKIAEMIGADELLSQIEEEEGRFEDVDREYSEVLTQKVTENSPFGNLVDRWVMYGGKESEGATHSAPVVEKAGLLRQLLEQEAQP